MILTDYYRMQELKPIKSHRLDCTASTGNYEPFEVIAQRARNKRFFVYYTDVPDSFIEDAKRGADKALTNGKSISSIFVPDLNNPLYGYGDTKGTDDALLFLFGDGYTTLDIFVARGYKNNVKGLFNLFLDGELGDEIEELRKAAKTI
jgi:hypothetical protein